MSHHANSPLPAHPLLHHLPRKRVGPGVSHWLSPWALCPRALPALLPTPHYSCRRYYIAVHILRTITYRYPTRSSLLSYCECQRTRTMRTETADRMTRVWDQAIKSAWRRGQHMQCMLSVTWFRRLETNGSVTKKKNWRVGVQPIIMSLILEFVLG